MKNSAIIKMLDERIMNDSINKSEEYTSSLDLVVCLEEKLKEKLRAHPELLELYEKANDALSNFNCATNRDYFLEGFKSGLLIGIESALE